MSGRPPRYTKTQVADQMLRCTQMRVAGTPMSAIAAAVGIADETVQARIDQWYREHPPAGAEQMRATLMARYEELFTALRPACQSGDTDAIDTTLDIFAAVRKMQGLDAPVRIEADVSHQIGR